MTPPDPDAVRAQLSIALRLLRRRAQTVFDTTALHGSGTIEDFASRWTRALVSSDVPHAQAWEVGRTIVDALIDPDRLETPEFWGSPLGQALALVGTVPNVVSRSVAAAILGLTRQRVAELLAQGKLTKAGDLGKQVLGVSVAARLCDR